MATRTFSPSHLSSPQVPFTTSRRVRVPLPGTPPMGLDAAIEDATHLAAHHRARETLEGAEAGALPEHLARDREPRALGVPVTAHGVSEAVAGLGHGLHRRLVERASRIGKVG